jgi:HlyD family secretion protein
MKNCIILGLGLALAVSVCPGAGNSSQERSGKDSSGAAVVQAIGTVEPEEVVELGSQVTGRIQSFGADPKDKNKAIDFNTVVNKGTILVQLDPGRYQAELALAKANLRRADAGFRQAMARAETAQKVSGKADVSISDLEMAKAAVLMEEATVAQAKAALGRAELELSYCTIRSPIDGIIVDRRCNVGQSVSEGAAAPSLFLIAKDLKKIQVWVLVKEADIARIAKGQLAQFTVDAFPGETFKGRVASRRLNATATQGVVSYTVVIEADNHIEKLFPYLTAHVNIEVGGRK